jgi:glutathione synthase/RimK-type ligase-like ATP-grasp enzyme
MGIDYKLVRCDEPDIILQLEDCDALMWHFYHTGSREVKYARQLLYAVEASGRVVFPGFRTVWHFDDKVGQKYLLEAVGAPLVPAVVFYSPEGAREWARSAVYPQVFKLRTGAGSSNVLLVRNQTMAFGLIRRAFSRGFRQVNPVADLKERWRKYRVGKGSLSGVLRGVCRLVVPTRFARMAGREKGYVYFQEFVPGNTFDTRVVVIGPRAFAIRRMVRKNDFRASGSGEILYEKTNFREFTIRLAFNLAENLRSQCVAFDFLIREGRDVIVEMSYGFNPEGYDACTGYWDRDLVWHPGPFNPYGWMVDDVVNKVMKIES